MSLIVTGSIGIDTVITPTGRADEVLGGSCTYFAAAASFFTKVRLNAVVGDDCPNPLLEVFDHFGVDTEGLEVRAGSKTFRWTGEYHENMNERDTLDVQPNVLVEPLPPMPDSYGDSKYVFLANTHPASQIELRQKFPDAKFVIADTMNLWIETALDDLKSLLSQIDGIVLNDSEAVQLTEKSNMIDAADAIAKMGPKVIVIKKGEHGCLMRHPEGLAVLPAYPTNQVVDPTGAGDSFAGGMMGLITELDDTSLTTMRKALAYGTVVASYNIASFSLDAMKSLTREQVDERYKSFAQMMNCV